jgi:predicted enzyme related to lactoylglutathione lyase
MSVSDKIDYVEFPARDISATKAFFESVFGWSHEDYGSEYAVFSDQGIDGGFFHSNLASSTESGGAFIVLYSDDLEGLQVRIEQAGGTITKAVFLFPGGRRFHFVEPSGNKMAVWSDGSV